MILVDKHLGIFPQFLAIITSATKSNLIHVLSHVYMRIYVFDNFFASGVARSKLCRVVSSMNIAKLRITERLTPTYSPSTSLWTCLSPHSCSQSCQQGMLIQVSYVHPSERWSILRCFSIIMSEGKPTFLYLRPIFISFSVTCLFLPLSCFSVVVRSFSFAMLFVL